MTLYADLDPQTQTMLVEVLDDWIEHSPEGQALLGTKDLPTVRRSLIALLERELVELVYREFEDGVQFSVRITDSGITRSLALRGALN